MSLNWRNISEIPGFEDFTNYSMNESGDLRNAKGYIMKWSADDRNGQLKLKVSKGSMKKTIYQFIALDRLFNVKSDYKPSVKPWFFHFSMDECLI